MWITVSRRERAEEEESWAHGLYCSFIERGTVSTVVGGASQAFSRAEVRGHRQEQDTGREVSSLLPGII